MRSCAIEASIIRKYFVVQQAVCDRLYSLHIEVYWYDVSTKYFRIILASMAQLRMNFFADSVHIDGTVRTQDILFFSNKLPKILLFLSSESKWEYYITLIFPAFLSQYLGPPNHYRIVTGLPIFSSSILIYKELGWESLAERRKRRKLQMFYKVMIRWS
jgi:hypothetical protein